MNYPDDNPKTALGLAKVPLHLVPPVSVAYEAMALKDGAKKYGPYNWRQGRITASTYIAACKRHIDSWWDGENEAQDSLVHHLGHAKACLGLLLDALSIGTLNDDRPPKGASSKVQLMFSEKIDVSPAAIQPVDRPLEV